MSVTLARRLRRDMTEAERRLWFALRDRRLADDKFRRQHPLNGAILDFACIAHRLATDAARTRRIAAQGWRIIRFWNNDILANTEGVVLTILAALREQPRVFAAPAPSPRPSPASGRGRR